MTKLSLHAYIHVTQFGDATQPLENWKDWVASKMLKSSWFIDIVLVILNADAFWIDIFDNGRSGVWFARAVHVQMLAFVARIKACATLCATAVGLHVSALVVELSGGIIAN